jgi:hypothetical protein
MYGEQNRISQDNWVFGLCPLSGILKNTKEHNLSETECFHPQIPKKCVPLRFLEYQMIDKDQKPTDPEY